MPRPVATEALHLRASCHITSQFTTGPKGALCELDKSAILAHTKTREDYATEHIHFASALHTSRRSTPEWWQGEGRIGCEDRRSLSSSPFWFRGGHGATGPESHFASCSPQNRLLLVQARSETLAFDGGVSADFSCGGVGSIIVREGDGERWRWTSVSQPSFDERSGVRTRLTGINTPYP
jgi:hypothetical protein